MPKMPQKQNICDCELCLFEIFPIDNPIRNNTEKIIEAIIYHFIKNLGNSIKSRKELNSHIINFITMIDQSYLSSKINSNHLKEIINLFYKKIINSKKGRYIPTHSLFSHLMHKEVIYLKSIINAMNTKQSESNIKIIITDVDGNDKKDAFKEPAPTSEIEPTPTSEIEPTPTSEIEPAPTSEIEPTPTSEIEPAPTSEIEPTPTSEIEPTPTSEIEPAPTSEIEPIEINMIGNIISYLPYCIIS